MQQGVSRVSDEAARQHGASRRQKAAAARRAAMAGGLLCVGRAVKDFRPVVIGSRLSARSVGRLNIKRPRGKRPFPSGISLCHAAKLFRPEGRCDMA